ncbi:MAG: serine/threonine-protein kinase [Acidobacteria bacterium]|nr:serine/threonine-protein kinase [Acidobacteriota bacterium]
MPETGQTISHYRIVEKIGQGGMGEVYLANDTTLDRKVALKFLPEAFTSDPERMARFEREAKLLASLNHPNIAGIYGLEQAEGNRFLVLEYVEGETLQSRLSKGALPLEDALELCRQIAEGLEAAHEKGVIHRDLKPANVMITAEEKVKILDFGLAKALADETQGADSSQSPTLTEAMTRPGVILGTAAYMSPEQAKGKSVDKRADIWAFGCILYECLTGKKAFEGETVAEMLAAVIKEEPDIDAAPAETRLLLRQCLAKDRKKRLRDIGDAMAWIEKSPGAVETIPIRRPWFAWSIAILGIVCTLTLGTLYFRRTPIEEPVRITEIITPPTLETTSLAISPDGSRIVFVGSDQGTQKLWYRLLSKRDAQPLPGTEGATFPFWSPDSRSIGFFAGGELKVIEIEGGVPISLADAPAGLGGTWNRDNVIVFTPNMGMPLHRVPAAGGVDAVAVTQLNLPSQTSHNFPCFLPDGQSLLYFAYGKETGIYLASLNSSETRLLFQADSPARYAPPDYLIFLRQSTLFARPFNSNSGKPPGDPIPVADSITRHTAYAHGGFSVSEDGVLIYRTINRNSRRQMVWFDRSGKEIEKLGEPLEGLMNPELSSDGSQLAVDQPTQGMEGNALVWLTETTRAVFSKLTSINEAQQFAVWSPNSSQIIFSSLREGAWDLHRMFANSSGEVEILLESSEPGIYRFAYDWSRDEKFLLYTSVDPKTNRDLWALPMTGSEHQPILIANTSFEELNGQFSPDAHWVAYQSNESGMYEIYVQPFPGPGTKKTVSIGGGTQPRWNPEGNEIYYIAPDDMLMAVPIHIAGNNVSVEDPIPLFPSRIPREGYMDIMRAQYDISPDGRRFLINTNVDNSAPSPITIVTNWTQSLNR